MQNPRANFIEAIREEDMARCLVKTAEIHGHYCPGSALGVMASIYALSLFGDVMTSSDGLENLMSIVEINACFTDGVQAVSGCTLGNNALIYRDLGKHAMTLIIRGNDTGVRVCARPDFRETIMRLVPAFYPLMEKVIKNRVHTKEDEQRFKDTAREAAFTLIKQDFEDLFSAGRVRADLPGYAPIVESIICQNCGEQFMSTKAAPNGTCLACAGKQYFQVEGEGIVTKTDK
ncbi:FmdE family protein [Desulfosarcina variabilis]|uniref:FmdE family protein n=1 Tax=Desulfosarcina variabilis TaxID=2300 RepID=UPI003AFB273E